MTEEQKARLEELRAVEEAERTEEQKAEMAELEALETPAAGTDSPADAGNPA